MYSRDKNSGMSSDAATSKLLVPVGRADEESTFFITDVWTLCERVLQRWMPEVGFDERVPEGNELIH